MVTRKAFRKRILNSKQILWYFGFRTWHKLHTDYKWILLFNLMGQAGRLHVFPWRSPPCFSSNKAHWLAAFVSCLLTPCRWTRRLTLEVRQCCSRCFLLFVTGAQPPSNYQCFVARILRYSSFVWSWSKVYALWSKGNAKYISALNLKLIIFATAIIHQPKCNIKACKPWQNL